jgi:hypothetical protein
VCRLILALDASWSARMSGAQGNTGRDLMSESYHSERVATVRAGEPWLTAECRRLVEQVHPANR